MIPFRRRTAAVIVFTALIIILVNIAWWLFYSETEKSFENQLSHRLASLARMGSALMGPELVVSLGEGFLSAYDSTLDIIGNIRDADSLSEVFVIDPDYGYLATTLIEPDSVYYLAALNRTYIDSVFSQNWLPAENEPDIRALVTKSYRVGEVYLKSAFAPLYDTAGTVAAVLGVEADVDYTSVLLGLRNNLYLSSIVSVAAGIIFGFFFFLIQRRINATERSLFLSQAQANLGRMVAVVSHEIKNPLMIMRASAERLEKSGLKEAQFIIEETDRLNNIVTGYLDFASGKRTLSLERVDLRKMLSSITEQFIPRLAREGVILASVGPTNAVPATADPVALRQVIINLILNGAEASKGMKNACVNVSCAVGSSQPMIEVKDNGKGMSAGEQKSIFEPFYTTKTTGSGLGLFLSRSLIRQMGGEIILQSKKGGPTLFRVTLPPADKV